MSNEKQLSIVSNVTDLANAPVEERKKFLQKVSEYIGAEEVDTDSILNVPIKVRGVIVHEATINKGDRVDPVTGELVPNYITAERTVFKRDDGKTIPFVSIAIANYAKNYLIPLFGAGDWLDENGNPVDVTIVIRQVTAKGGRSYNIQVVGD